MFFGADGSDTVCIIRKEDNNYLLTQKQLNYVCTHSNTTKI